MPPSEESTSQISGAIGPTLVVLLTGLLAYFTHEPTLESRRPDQTSHTLVPPPPAIKGLNAIHSRLWDDPLAVAYEDSQRRHEKEESLEQLAQEAFSYGKADAAAGARWELSLEQHVWGTTLPDFSLAERARLLREYGQGWQAAGRPLPSEQSVP